MEVFFECVYEETLELIYRLHKKVLRPTMIAICIVFGVGAALYWMVALHSGRPAYYVLAVILTATVLWYATMARRNAKKMIKNKLKYYNGQNPPITVQFGDEIIFQDVDSYRAFPYDKIGKIFTEKNCLILKIGKAYHCISTENFTKGDLNGLLAFLREKCPQAKMPEWKW